MAEFTLSPDQRRAFTRKAVVLVWIAAALLAAGVTHYWRISPDSALYVGIAKAIANGDGYTFSGEAQPSIPPVSPLYLAGAYRVAKFLSPDGSPARIFFFLNAFSALAGMAGILAALFLMLELSRPRETLIALLLLVTSHRYFSLSTQPLSDILYAAGSWTALLFLVRASRSGRAFHWIAAAALMTASVLTRLVGGALLLSVLGYHGLSLLLGKGRARKAIAAMLAALPALAAAAFYGYLIFASRDGATFNYWNDLAAGRTAGEMFSRAAYDVWTVPANLFHAVTGLDSIWGLGFVLTAVAAWGWVSHWRSGERLVTLYSLVYLLYVAAGEEVRPRYVAPLLPFVFLYLIRGASEIARVLASRFDSSSAADRIRGAGMILLSGVIAVNLFYTGREIGRNFSRDFYMSYRHGIWRDYIVLANALKNDPPPGAIMTYRPRALFVLSGLPTVGLPYHPETSYRPTAEEAADFVKARDVGAVVIDPANAESAHIFTDLALRLQAERHAEAGRLGVYVFRREETDSRRL